MDIFENFASSVNSARNNILVFTPLNTSGNITINPNIKDSLLFFDINSKIISITDKCNHILLRNCKNCNLVINSSVSGLDIILSNFLTVNFNSVNYIDLYTSSDIELFTNKIPKIDIHFSMDISINSQKINLSPFEIYTN